MQHRPGKSIGHADGLSRIPFVNQVTTSQIKRKLDEPVETKFLEHIQKKGNLLESKDSLAHCISLELKRPAGVARENSVQLSLELFVQEIDDRFIYHLVTKKRLFQTPTYDILRQSLEAMMNHANKHKFTQISKPTADFGLDRLERHKVVCVIKKICAHSNSTITVYDRNKSQK